MAVAGSSFRPVDQANIDEICTTWVQKKYGSKYDVVQVNTSDLKVVTGNIKYSERDRKENHPVRRSGRTFVNRSSNPLDQEFSAQSTTKYSCAWTQTKGGQISGDLSVKVGLPAAVGLSAKVGGQVQLSNAKTDMSGTDETFAQKTTFRQNPRSIVLTETVTTQKTFTMHYSLDFHLEGTVSITLQNAKKKKKPKIESLDVADLYPEGKTVTDSGGKRSVLFTHEGIFEASTEMGQEVKVEEPDPDKLMKMIHKVLLRDNREKIVEEVKEKPAMSRLLEVMSSEQVISEEQSKNVSQNTSVKECVNELVDVLQNVEPEKFLLFVDILQKEGYSELVELLDPRQIYPDNIRHIANLSGVVDHYFVTKKESEVKNNLELVRGTILHGMPGSGKTQLAIKVAGDYARMHPHVVVWVLDGSSKERLQDGIEKLQQKLDGETNVVDISIFQSLISRWKHFLLIINDLSPTVAIPHQLMRSSAKLIITTQNSFLELEDVRSIQLEGFTEDEAVAFLSSKMTVETSREEMRALANIFSRLPLGLAAARASIHRGQMTVAEYRLQLQGGLSVVMDREDRWLRKYYKPEHQEAARNIFAALQLAIDSLDDECSPNAEKKCKVMLQPCAFLDPNNIPILLLKAALTSSSTIGSEAHFTERMRMYSLGSIDGEGVKRHLSIHGVTQRALHLQMDNKQQTTTCVNKLLQILVKFFSKDTMYAEMYKFSVSLIPHVEATLKHADKLDLGPEYPLMKARLLMVYGHLLIQKGSPELSEIPLQEAKKLLLAFAGISLDRFYAMEQDTGYDTFKECVLKELYKPLTDKSQSLKDSFFQETVIRRIITRQHLRTVSGKLSGEDRIALENMVVHFEPLTTELHLRLVENNLAMPVEALKKTFLIELYIFIVYTFAKTLLPNLWFKFPSSSSSKTAFKTEQLIALHMCSKVKEETGFTVLSSFLTYYKSISITVIMGDLDETNPIRKANNTMQAMLDNTILYYDLGLLTSGDGDIFSALNRYENTIMWFYRLACNSKHRIQRSEELGNCLFLDGLKRYKAMLALVEGESQASNPPQDLATYYIIAGNFLVEAGQFEMEVQEGTTELLAEAVEMYWKAYKVELKRGEYHPRMEEALTGLIVIYVIQREPRKALVCARRLLQLSQDHWPNKATRLPSHELLLPRVYKKIAFQALKQNKEEEKYNRIIKVTTV